MITVYCNGEFLRMLDEGEGKDTHPAAAANGNCLPQLQVAGKSVGHT